LIAKQFNAFYHDFKNRLNIFVGGEPWNEEVVKRLERKERESKEEKRREGIRIAYAKNNESNNANRNDG